MTIRIYSTLTKTKEAFEPVVRGKVGIYLCGPTVYKESHIGHMVGPVIFDTIKRYLTYSGYEVKWVVNITDVDDKLIGQQRERGVPMAELPPAACLSSADSVFFFTCRSMFFSIVARPRCSASSDTSIMVTGMPDCANTCAIPFPICPAPMTATRSVML